MIILKENKLLENSPSIEDPEKTPIISLYKNAFDSKSIRKIYDILESMILVNDQSWFADTPNINFLKHMSVKPFTLILDKIKHMIERITCRSFNTCVINRYKGTDIDLYKINHKILGFDFVIPTVSIGQKRDLIFSSKTTTCIGDLPLDNGSVLVEDGSVHKYWRQNLICSENILPFYNISFYNLKSTPHIPKYKKNNVKLKKLPLKLENIYICNDMRVKFTKQIRDCLSGIRSIPKDSQLITNNTIKDFSKCLTLGKLIGKGDWGNVYTSSLSNSKNKRQFALKMSRITEQDFKNPYTETNSTWYETWILKDILRPLVKKNICPNLPLFIDTFLCSKFDFTFNKDKYTHPCVITAIELASGDLRHYFKFCDPSIPELYSALFQIMAGLHAIQIYGQILNNDIKAKNILCYDVKSGGYWHYRIGDNDFYVPNYGKMFVLNDFGVSNLYNPNFQLYPNKKVKTFNLGSRFAINIEEKFSPVESTVEYINDIMKDTSTINWTIDGSLQQSRGAIYKIDRKTGQVIISNTVITQAQKLYLFKKGISTNPTNWSYFEHPYIIPPFEFYNDLQDVLRTFVGGKRTTQKGDHKLYPSIPKKFHETIKPYMGLAENTRCREFSSHTYQVLAGSFIKKFFTLTVKYTKKPIGVQISSSYDMNKYIKHF
jgi:hypothetical protein